MHWMIGALLAVAAPGDDGGACLEPGTLAIESRLPLAGCGAGRALSLPGSGGTVTANGTMRSRLSGQQVFGTYCTGYFLDEPFACFRVPAGGAEIDLEVVDGGNTDTTLAIRSEGDVLHCDDDGGMGLLSRLRVSLDAGVYYVYVGSFSSDVAVSFEIELRRP